MALGGAPCSPGPDNRSWALVGVRALGADEAAAHARTAPPGGGSSGNALPLRRLREAAIIGRGLHTLIVMPAHRRA